MTTTSRPKSLGTVLVIGGCGFLGAAVVDQLLNFPSENLSSNLTAATQSKFVSQYPLTYPPLRGRYPSFTSSPQTTVHALDLNCTRNTFKGCTYHECDITSAQSLLKVFEQVKPDVIINTASPQFDSPKPILQKVNVDGTRTLLEVASGRHGNWGKDPSRVVFVHTSSSSVVHDGTSELVNATEEYPYVYPNKFEYYSETKVLAEQLVLEANGKEEYGGMLTCAVRPAGISGPGDRAGFSFAMCQTACQAPDWQLHLQLGSGGNLFSVTYVGNVAYALLLCAEALLETARRKSEKGAVEVLSHERVDGEAFNVTNDEPVGFWESAHFCWSRYGRDVKGEKVWAIPEGLAYALGLASEVAAWVSGRKSKFNRTNVRYAIMQRYFSCDKLKRRLGYEAVVPIDEAFGRTILWYKAEVEREGIGKKSQ